MVAEAQWQARIKEREWGGGGAQPDYARSLEPSGSVGDRAIDGLDRRSAAADPDTEAAIGVAGWRGRS